jgi:UTP--glucose-1-phosphate uridylyltransferase
MIESHLKYDSACTVGVRPVTRDMVGRYGIVTPDPVDDLNPDSFSINDLVEKPGAAEAPSLMAVSARYVFSPDIFDEIRGLTQATCGELGVTDAIRSLISRGKSVRCVRLLPDETRYDIGSHASYYRAFIDFALQDPECGEKIREYIKACVENTDKKL